MKAKSQSRVVSRGSAWLTPAAYVPVEAAYILMHVRWFTCRRKCSRGSDLRRRVHNCITLLIVRRTCYLIIGVTGRKTNYSHGSRDLTNLKCILRDCGLLERGDVTQPAQRATLKYRTYCLRLINRDPRGEWGLFWSLMLTLKLTMTEIDVNSKSDHDRDSVLTLKQIFAEIVR